MVDSDVFWTCILTLIAGAGCCLYGFRGRVVACGLFCRRCRFELSGLDLDARDSSCPECGTSTSAPRRFLRRCRYGFVALSALFLALSAACWFAQVPRVQAWLLPRLSDTALLGASQIGIESAQAEVTIRLTDPARDCSGFASLIEGALVAVLQEQSRASLHQQHYLAAALSGAHLSPGQLQRYVEAAFRIELHMRDLASGGQDSVPVSVRFTQLADFFDSTIGNLSNTGYTVEFSIDCSGTQDSERWFTRGYQSGHYSIEQTVSLWGGTTMGWRHLKSPVLDEPEGPVALVAARIRVFDPTKPGVAAEIVESARRPIEIVPAAQLWAEVSDDPELAQRFATSIRVGSVTVMRPRDKGTVAQVSFPFKATATQGIAGCFRIRMAVEEGDPVWLDGLVMIEPVSNETARSEIVTLGVSMEAADAIAGSDRVELFLVPDPAGAYGSPRLTVISGEGLRFHGVRVLDRSGSVYQHGGHFVDETREAERVPADSLPSLPAMVIH